MGKFNLPHYNLGQAIIQAILEFRHTIMHYAGFWGWGDPYPFKIFLFSIPHFFFVLSFIGFIHMMKQKKNITTYLLFFPFSRSVFIFSWFTSQTYSLFGGYPGKIFVTHFSCPHRFSSNGGGGYFQEKDRRYECLFFLVFALPILFHFVFCHHPQILCLKLNPPRS